MEGRFFSSKAQSDSLPKVPGPVAAFTHAPSHLPSVSVIIPTLDSARTIRQCLQSILAQDYPAHLEILVADGGSTDSTQRIVQGFRVATILKNPKRTGEAGKAVGLGAARHDIVAFIDSDNVLPSPDWLRRMVEPFQDTSIVASEPIRFDAAGDDHPVSRYFAHLGMNDPLCLFLGNYDRMSALTGRWTDVDHEFIDYGTFLKVRFLEDRVPTMGANGFLVRRAALEAIHAQGYVFDVDMFYRLVASQSWWFAKVKVGIVHYYAEDLAAFARKQSRRIMDFLYYRRRGLREFPWAVNTGPRILLFVLMTLTGVPVLLQTFRGWTRTRDPAFLVHPLACLVTLGVYAWTAMKAVFVPASIQGREAAERTNSPVGTGDP